MSDYGPDCGGRVKGVTIVKPIVYGNVARYFGKKREEDGHTHSWNVYVKPYHNEDMSTYVKKVHFKLHESYANPNRIVTKPPFEVTETGWGEFEVSIKLHFMDPNERPITIYHILKLFETDPQSKAINIKKYLVSEFYDEIIFQDPSAMMQQLLTNTRQITIGPYKHETDFEEKKQKTMASILSAKTKVRNEIEELKERLKTTQTTIAKFKEDIKQIEVKQEQEQKQQDQKQAQQKEKQQHDHNQQQIVQHQQQQQQQQQLLLQQQQQQQQQEQQLLQQQEQQLLQQQQQQQLLLTQLQQQEQQLEQQQVHQEQQQADPQQAQQQQQQQQQQPLTSPSHQVQIQPQTLQPQLQPQQPIIN